MTTIYELFTWKYPHDSPYLLVFSEEPKPATNGLSHYELYRVEISERGEITSSKCIAEWSKGQ